MKKKIWELVADIRRDVAAMRTEQKLHKNNGDLRAVTAELRALAAAWTALAAGHGSGPLLTPESRSRGASSQQQTAEPASDDGAVESGSVQLCEAMTAAPLAVSVEREASAASNGLLNSGQGTAEAQTEPEPGQSPEAQAKALQRPAEVAGEGSPAEDSGTDWGLEAGKRGLETEPEGKKAGTGEGSSAEDMPETETEGQGTEEAEVQELNQPERTQKEPGWVVVDSGAKGEEPESQRSEAETEVCEESESGEELEKLELPVEETGPENETDQQDETVAAVDEEAGKPDAPETEHDAAGRTALHRAAEQGRTTELWRLVSKGADIAAPGPRARTALHLAAAAGHTESVRVLLEAQADPICKDADGRTALDLATAAGHAQAAELLVPWADSDRLAAALSCAAEADSPALVWAAVRRLPTLACGARAAEALGRAAAVSAESALRALLAAGAEPWALWQRRSAVHAAAAAAGGGGCLRALLEAAAGTQVPDGAELRAAADLLRRDAGYGPELGAGSALLLAVRRCEPTAARLLARCCRHLEVRTTLLPAMKVAVERQCADCQSALLEGAGLPAPALSACLDLVQRKQRSHAAQEAAKLGAGPLPVRMLLACVAANEGETVVEALRVAAKTGPGKGMEALLKARAQISANWSEYYWAQGTADGQTPLHVAAAAGNAVDLRLLLRAGAPVDTQDRERRTALYLAAQGGREECLHVLFNYGAKPDLQCTDQSRGALHCAAEQGHIKCVRALLEYGAAPGLRDSSKVTPLHLAAKGGHTAAVQALLNAKCEASALSQHSELALRYAAEGGHTECVRALLRAGVDANHKDRQGYTAVYYAAQAGKVECLKVLLAASQRNVAECEEKILRVCVQRGHDAVVQTLLEAGVKCESPSHYRYGCYQCPLLHEAAREGHASTVQILLNCGAKLEGTDSNNHSALYMAVQEGHHDIMKMLLAAGMKVSTDDLCIALERSRSTFAEELLRAETFNANCLDHWLRQRLCNIPEIKAVLQERGFL